MRTSALRWWSWWVASAVVLLPALAYGQDVSQADHDAAVTNFQAGRRFVEQNDCKDAIPRFIESLKHEQNVGARFNLAECSKKEGRLADAWNQYKGAEQLAIQKNDERANDARGPLAELEPKVTKLRLVLPQIADAVVRIDGKVIEATDFNLLGTGYALTPNDPHTIEVTARDYKSWTRTDVKGAAGAELPAMTVELGEPTTGANQRLAGLIIGGVGVASVIVGSVFGLLAAKARSDAKTACETGGHNIYPSCVPSTPGGSNNPAVDDPNNNAKTDAMISTITFVAGGVLVAAGAVLYFTAPKPASTSAARIRLTPALGPSTAGAAIGGTF